MKNIKNILISITITLLLITITASAGSETDPEITDEEHDLYGPRELIPFPQLLYPIFKNIDIISGWFTENTETPDTLQISVKLKIIKQQPFMNRIVVWWIHNDTDCIAAYLTHSRGAFEVGLAGYIDNQGTEHFQPVQYNINLEKNIITFNIPKSCIRNPQPGDYLTYPWIWTGTQFQNDILLKIFNFDLAKDYSNPMIGTAYQILY